MSRRDREREASAFLSAPQAPMVAASQPATTAEVREVAAIAPARSPLPSVPAKSTTLCRVTGSAVQHKGEFFPEGSEFAFPDEIVAALPHILIPVQA